MHVDKSKNPSFNGVRYINTVTDMANNSMVKAFEKNKEYDLFLRKLDGLTEWKIEKANSTQTLAKKNPWVTLWGNVQLTKEAVDKYLKLFF